MRAILLGLAVLLAASSVEARGSHAVHGYVTRRGTVVAPHRQTNPDSTRANNYSTKGNVNPFTGKEGDKPLVK